MERINEELSNSPEKKSRHSVNLFLVLTIATSLALAACSSPKEVQATVGVRITYPQDGDLVNFRSSVEGTVQNRGDGNVWVAVTDEHDRVLHPQEGPAKFTSGKDWNRSNVRIGNHEVPEPGEDITHFISILISTSEGEKTLEDYMRTCHQENFCPGYDPTNLPAGVTWLPDTTVTVHRQPVAT